MLEQLDKIYSQVEQLKILLDTIKKLVELNDQVEKLTKERNYFEELYQSSLDDRSKLAELVVRLDKDLTSAMVLLGRAGAYVTYEKLKGNGHAKDLPEEIREFLQKK